MEGLSSCIGTPLYWVQPKTFDRQFELRMADGRVAAYLRFETALGTLATGQTADQRWSFKRIGFLNPRVTVREPGADVNVAVFYPKWFGNGSLEFADGRFYSWDSTNFWGTEWSFFDRSGQLFVALKPGSETSRISDLFKTQAIVEIHSGSGSLSDVPMLILLGWYLLILRQDDTAAAVAATTATM